MNNTITIDDVIKAKEMLDAIPSRNIIVRLRVSQKWYDNMKALPPAPDGLTYSEYMDGCPVYLDTSLKDGYACDYE